MDTLLKENLIADALAWVEALDHEVQLADLVQADSTGVEVHMAGETLAFVYNGTNSFMSNMRSWVQRGKSLTNPQLRVVLKIYAEDVRKAANKPMPLATNTGSLAPGQIGVVCGFCGTVCKSYDELTHHQDTHHGIKPTPVARTSPEIPQATGQAVIADLSAVTGLDLSGLPDGRYAAPDPSGKNDNVFLWVKRIRRTHFRDRRFRYGKIVTGSEVTHAGTIEVRIWSGDTKELVGEQRPGDVYRGKYEDQLNLIGHAPDIFATLFGKLCGHCGMCGKTLTDEVSRSIGLGLDCEKKRATYFTTKPESHLAECPICHTTDLILLRLEEDKSALYMHGSCGTQFTVDKQGNSKTLSVN